jgi:plastocyanin
MRRTLFVLASLVAVPAGIYACSSDDTPATTAGTDSGTATPDGGGGTDSAKVDSSQADTSTPAPGQVLCTQAEFDKVAGPGGGDFTAFPGADITFPTDAIPAQYTNHCVKVKVGSKVTFAGSFTNHPLEPMGGDTPTPITAQSADTDGGAVSVTFTTQGKFGFQCNFHPNIMFGGVQVVP